MTRTKLRRRALLLPFVLYNLLVTTRAVGQVLGESPTDLVKLLTHESDRQSKTEGIPTEGITFDCGITKEDLQDRATAKALIKFGAAAITAIDQVFGSMEQPDSHWGDVVNVRLLLNAYAKIRGPAAWPRFKEMSNNPGLDYIRVGLDDATALAFGFTSYVSADRAPARIFRCRGQAAGCFEPIDPGLGTE